MGSSKSKIVVVNEFKKFDPFFYYLNRAEEIVYYVSEDKIDRKKFNKPAGFLEDSGLGLVNDFSVMLVGGCDRFGRMKKVSFIVDMDKMFIRTVSKINFPCKAGSIVTYLGSIYYVGGLFLKSKQDSTSESIPGPLFKYMILENSWQVLLKSGFSETITEEVWSQNFPISHLYRPGNFIMKNILYYIGGNTQLGSNALIYALDLSNPTPKFKALKFRLPVSLISPLCSSNSKFAFICGGYSDDRPSKACFKFNPKHGFKEIPGKNLELTENFPPKLKESYLIYCAFPKFALRTKSMKNWKIFNLSGSSCMISLTQKTLKKSLPPLTRSERPKETRKNSVKPSTPMPYLTDQDSAYSSQILHISCSKINTHSKTSIPKRNNSPENSAFNSVFSFRSQDEIIIEEVVSRENDHLVNINKKVALKILVFALKELDNFTVDPLLLHQISFDLGLRPEISVAELFELFVKMLRNIHYSYNKIKQCLMSIHKNNRDARVRTKKLNEILEFLQIPDIVAHVSKETTALILTRIIKALIGA